jgi:hypothetical protein
VADIGLQRGKKQGKKIENACGEGPWEDEENVK